MSTQTPTLAGLGYVGLAAPDPAAWSEFGAQICGAMPVSAGPSEVSAGSQPARYLKLDDQRPWRIAVHAGEPGLRYLGFAADGTGGIEAWARKLEEAGVAWRRGTPAECTAREVAALLVLNDPAGHQLELFAPGASGAKGSFVSPRDVEFLVGELGMGHVVLYVPELTPALAFYREVLGFERTDYANFGPGGIGIHFLRCTRRHHSVALLHLGDLRGLQHLMLETTSLDAVGQALDRATAAGVKITSSLGRHINDLTVSFYMRGPSGFDVEIGWDGLLVDESWVEHEFSGGGDLWGHQGLDAESLKPPED